jgi:hypothetical protein
MKEVLKRSSPACTLLKFAAANNAIGANKSKTCRTDSIKHLETAPEASSDSSNRQQIFRQCAPGFHCGRLAGANSSWEI